MIRRWVGGHCGEGRPLYIRVLPHPAALIHWLASCTHSLSHSPAQLACSLAPSLAHSLAHSLTYSHSLTNSLTHSPYSLTRLPHSLTHSLSTYCEISRALALWNCVGGFVFSISGLFSLVSSLCLSAAVWTIPSVLQVRLLAIVWTC